MIGNLIGKGNVNEQMNNYLQYFSYLLLPNKGKYYYDIFYISLN